VKHFITLSIIFLLAVSAVGQVTFTGYLVDADDKKMKDVEIIFFKGNEKISTKKWSKKFEYNLALEEYYTLELVKVGFLSKRIAISTFEGRKNTDFMFVMELIEKKEGEEEDDFPSALIEYRKNEGSFNFDIKYAKDIKKRKKEAKKKKN